MYEKLIKQDPFPMELMKCYNKVCNNTAVNSNM